jgi:GMP synthase-like glutamine amidotransferase
VSLDVGRALIIEHERATPGGRIQEWLSSREIGYDVLDIDRQGDGHDFDPRDYGLVVSLGSEFPAYDDTLPWLAHEMSLLDAACSADVPVLGVCFGGQLLARVLGGDVFRSDVEEIGWLEIGSRNPELVPDGPWFQWHFDTFTVPSSATTLAANAVGPQAFQAGRSLGIQFHPEVTPEIMTEWVAVYRHELVDNNVDPDRLLGQTYELVERARTLSTTLFESFMTRIAHRP